MKIATKYKGRIK